jgi:phosphoribosylformylglycinamidine cyclo-ligase
VIEQAGKIELQEMLRTFNYGIGMVVVTELEHADAVVRCLEGMGERGFRIGEILAREDREQHQVTWS